MNRSKEHSLPEVKRKELLFTLRPASDKAAGNRFD